MNILITICARGGSKGIPGKNIRLMNGKPLIAYSIETAKKFSEKYNCDIALSTDSADIKAVAEAHGLKTEYVRPAELANDIAGKIVVINHILDYEEKTRNKKYDFVLDLDVTSPLRNMDDLEAGLKMILADEGAYNLYSASVSNGNPYFNMLEKKPNGYYNLIIQAKYFSRQESPEVYQANGSFYFYKKSFFETKQPIATTDHTIIYVSPHICFDLDHIIDFDFMEYLMINNKLDFKL